MIIIIVTDLIQWTNIHNFYRETALMYACMSRNAEFVMELIKYVQNIDACDSNGKTVSFQRY